MAIYITGWYGEPATAIIISAYNKAEALQAASKELGVSVEDLADRRVLGPGDPLPLERLFTGHAVGKPRAVHIDPLF